MIEQLATPYGSMFLPSTDEGQYWWVKTSGLHPEAEYIDTVCAILAERPKGVIFDVGSNFGCWAIPLAKYATEVFAFEPQRCCADLIVKALAANGISNVDVINEAVGEMHGSVMVPQLDIDASTNFGGISLVGVNDQQPDAPLASVLMVALDDYLTSDSVSFIKIDVEGGELAVLKGASKIIARDRPLMFMEYDHPLGDAAKLEEFLTDAGYACAEFGPNWLCMPL